MAKPPKYGAVVKYEKTSKGTSIGRRPITSTMNKKIALIFGITGQDGSYLAELLLKKKYKVYGVKRRTSLIHTTRIDHIYEDFHLKPNLILKYGDVTDFSNVFTKVNI